MRFYNQQHRFYCGVDLHARTLSLCVLDAVGSVVLHELLKNWAKWENRIPGE